MKSILLSVAIADSITLPTKLSQSGYYTAQVLFGSNLEPANLALDTGFSQTIVTSDLCPNCSSRVYIAGMSSTTHDTGLRYQLDSEYDRLSV